MVMTSKETMDNFYDPKCGVYTFLEQIGLSQYYDMFLAKGFDSEKDLRFVERKDLDTMCITNKKHRDLIISQACLYRPSEEQELYEWLRENMLEYYYINFLQSGRDNLNIIQQMVLPDDDIYDDLEIMLPGHRKRLERAVVRLQKQSQSSNDVEYPVAYGKWMKPNYLEYAKFDFLCIDATIFSTKDKGQQEEIVFMVDSGSDVVTLRPEIVQRLNLVKKCTVRSQGVHVAKEKTLYEPKLKIGSVELKIELIPEEYNSLGNRVFRHFRHYINGSRHVWLKGDYMDPSMEVTTPEQHYNKEKFNNQSDLDDSTKLETELETETASSLKNECYKTLCKDSNLIEQSRSKDGTEEENEDEKMENAKLGESCRLEIGKCPDKDTASVENFLPSTSPKDELSPPVKTNPKQCFFSRKRQRATITSHFNKKARRKIKRND